MGDESKNSTELIKSNCTECGIELLNPPQWASLYCAMYCCGHCPDRTSTPCQKEIFEAKKAGIKPMKGGIELALDLWDLQQQRGGSNDF